MKPRYVGIWTTVFVAVFAALCLGQVRQSAPRVLPSITTLMSHEEFSRAGLAKLNKDEIAALDMWLEQYRLAIVAKTKAGNLEKEGGDNAIETQIDGGFKGWDGDTVWKMTNGQIWQQASLGYHYHYAHRPKVLIYRVGGDWKMKVEEDEEEVVVKRLK